MGSDSEGKAASSRWCAACGINLHKILLPVVIGGLMVWYDCFTPTAWTYLATHGGYGILWVAKDLVYGDKRFRQPISFTDVLFVFVMVSVLYFPFPLILVHTGADAPMWYNALCIFLYTVGLFLMHGSDCQKFFQLKHAPGMLVTDGFFAHLRNPNYLGEIAIYCALAALTCSLWTIPLLLTAIFLFMLPGMKEKDKSLSRYQGFAAWKAKTNLVIPFLY